MMRQRANSKLVLYFIKYPETGKVKTRLAYTVGARTACSLYKDLAEKNYQELLRLKSYGITTWVLFDPPEKDKEVRSWLSGAEGYVPQVEGNLGLRLESAFYEGFKAGYSSIAAFGSDTLDFGYLIGLKAFDGLRHQDVVIGPASDGGYYWIGLSKQTPELFREIAWSTSEVLEQTVRVMERQGLSFDLLDKLQDMDEEDSLTGRGEWREVLSKR